MNSLFAFSAGAGMQSPDLDLHQKGGEGLGTKGVNRAATKCPTCNVAQQALDAAHRFVLTGVDQLNPYAGFKLESAWTAAYDRNVLALIAEAHGEVA